MSLKDRLDALRRQAGAAPAPPLTPASDLRARLERLGGRAAAPSASRASGRESPERLAERLGGQLIDHHLIRIERCLPLHTAHGRWTLAFGREPAAPLVELPERAAYVDTETTGLAGGTGTTAFMVGMASFEGEHVRLRQWLITAFAGEAAMLAEVRRALAEAELIVSYNGKAFDLPLLRDRQRLHGATLAEPEHFDLLHSVRWLFMRSWPDCRLSTVERRLLGLQRRDDLPGAEAPQAWRDFLAGVPGHALHRVVEHNAIDLLSMLVLPPALARAVRNPLDYGADPAGAAAIWARLGERRSALETLLDCRERLDRRGCLQLAAELKRAGRWEEAVELWQILARQGCQRSIEELAKYHEHVRRDWATALAYAERLADTPAARARRARLARRLARVDDPSLDLGSVS